jgi:AmmeMemoRadiSam system protein A
MLERAPALSPGERQALLLVARAAIRDRLLRDGTLAETRAAIDLTPALRRTAAAFVTLEAPDPSDPFGDLRLRGCIGTLEAHDPLVDCVAHNAIQAAFSDPRFPPLDARELSGIVVSVSVLTPAESVPGPEAIVLGRDGVVFEKGCHRSVFLPEVAVEQGWDVRALLEHLALKAGLPRDAWEGGGLRTFRTEVFCEPRRSTRDGVDRTHTV